MGFETTEGEGAEDKAGIVAIGRMAHSPWQRSAHTALQIRQFLTSRHDTCALPPPYSPDLAPAEFFLFPRMKRDLKGRQFDTVEDVIAASTRALNSIQVEEFQRCFEQWKQSLDKCISSNGEYFEGD